MSKDLKISNEVLRAELVKILEGKTPSDEQWAAIEAPLAPGLIVAGAGTGKTTVMAARIAWLVMSGQISPDRILGLTFTTKATSELANRVRKYLAGAIKFATEAGFYDKADEVGEPTILTYNSFGSKLLKEHALRLGLEPDARVVVDATRYQLAMRIVCNTEIDLSVFSYRPIDAASHLLELDERLANYLIEPEQVIAYDQEAIELLKTSDKPQKITEEMIVASSKRIAIAKLVVEFRQAKINADIYDYSDQIRLAAKAALSSSAMQQMLRDQFGVVLLDEYQDTSVGQKVLLQALFGNGHPVTAVGDPCQAIYGWRGAEITNMDMFPTDFPTSVDPVIPAQQFNLTGNRRSGKNILTAANVLSDELRTIHPIISPLVAVNPDRTEGEIKVGLLTNFAEEVNWVADQIASLNLTDRWGEVAILIREKKNIGDFVKALEELDIPVQVADAGDLVDLPEVRDVISYLEIVADPTANTALARILTSPRFAIGPRDLALLGRAASDLVKDEFAYAPFNARLEQVTASVDRVDRACLLDALELAGESEIEYSAEARDRMVKLSAELRELRRHSSDSVTDLINRIVRTTGLGVQAMLHYQDKKTTGFDRIAALLDLAGSYTSLDGETSLRAFITFLRDATRFDKHSQAEITSVDNAVTVMSVHKSKGLEFPVVVLPSMTASVFPSTKALSHWPKNPNLIPGPLLPKNVYSQVPVFPADNSPRAKDYDAYKNAQNVDREIDERRLGYVAVTRAEHTVIASSSWWGPSQSKLRGPSDFLVTLHKHSTEIGPWTASPSDEENNPLIENAVGIAWPQDAGKHIRPKLIEAAKLVNSATTDDLSNLTESELELVSNWDADLTAINQEFELSAQTSRVVKLPANLSASQVMDLKKDEQEFLKSLVRPMPRQPSPAASRGTKFHAWVEEFFKQRALFDPESLPGSVDSDIYTDQTLEEMKKAFEEGLFAGRTPHALEQSFAMLINGRTWIGRMDAVFSGTVDNPAADGWLVVDWKTGRPGSADELQLSIYRHALAELKQCDPEKVQAAFYYVSAKEIYLPEQTLTRSELEQLI